MGIIIVCGLIKLNFYLLKSEVDYALTTKDAPKGSKRSYEKDNKLIMVNYYIIWLI